MDPGRRVLLGLLASLAPAVPPVPARPAPLTVLDAQVEGMLREWKVPGLALAVVGDGEVLHARGYGVREVGTADPLDAHTLFAVRSTSKAFTAAAPALLADGGDSPGTTPSRTTFPGSASGTRT